MSPRQTPPQAEKKNSTQDTPQSTSTGNQAMEDKGAAVKIPVEGAERKDLLAGC